MKMFPVKDIKMMIRRYKLRHLKCLSIGIKKLMTKRKNNLMNTLNHSNN